MNLHVVRLYGLSWALGSPGLAGSSWLAGVSRSWRAMCDGGVAAGGGVVEAEHGGEVEGVGAAGEGFFELPVGAEALQGGGQAAACFGEPVLADGPGGHGGLLVDDQVGVGGAGPAVAAVLEPGQEQVAGQVIERS